MSGPHAECVRFHGGQALVGGGRVRGVRRQRRCWFFVGRQEERESLGGTWWHKIRAIGELPLAMGSDARCCGVVVPESRLSEVTCVKMFGVEGRSTFSDKA